MRCLPLRRSAAPSYLGAALAMAVGLAVPGTGDAQIFAGVGATIAGSIPEAGGANPVPSRSAGTRETLRFLPNTLDGLRVSGEVGDLRWPIYLTKAQADAPVSVRIGYVSAVSVLPDASTLEVEVNGRRLGTDVIDAAEGLRTVEFAVPPGILARGYNAVSLHISQRHRVDCSVAATYELWTRIEPSETGIVLPDAARTITDLDDLPGLLPRADGTLPIHILLSGKTNPTHLARLIVSTQEIALITHAQQPAVDFGAPAADAFGINLALGTRKALGRIAQLGGALGGEGPLVKLLPASGEGRPTLVVSGTSERDVEAAIAALSAMYAVHGTPDGLAALASYPAFKTDGGAHLKLRDVGMSSREFSGRFFRQSFNLTLPADFLASDYARGTFDLAGGYAAGLTRDAQVRVDVNGRSSGVIKLPDARGAVFRHNQLFVPLSLMRPGLNRFDIIAATPRPDDAICAASNDKRFLFLNSSELVLPTLARVMRVPDLAMTTSGALPYASGTARLVVPKPDRDTMSAALSLTARAAVAAGHVIPFTFATKTADNYDGSTLVVSPARALDPAMMSDVGLDPKAVEAAWRGAMPTAGQPRDMVEFALRRWWLAKADGPSACRLAGVAPSVAAPAAAAEPPPTIPAVQVARIDTDGDDILGTWSGDARPRETWAEQLASLTASVGGWARKSVRAIQWPAANAGGDGISPSASLILAQGSNGGRRVTTIVTAPDSATLRASISCLFDPQVWTKVHGRLAVLDASDGDVTATDADRVRFVSSETNSLANSRLVLAGWFSLNPLAFVALALLTALCLSGTTLWFVRGVGRRAE